MSVTVVRYETKPERADENQAFVDQVFAALAAERPGGLTYETFRLDDGVTFVHVASVSTADGSHPLVETPAFATFQEELMDRCVAAPLVMAATGTSSTGLP